jgi:hypothetical protein
MVPRISANPKSRSSAGAEKIRRPTMASGWYITMFFEVSHQFVRNWKGKIIPYEVQNAGRVSIEFLKRNRSAITAMAKAVIAISV